MQAAKLLGASGTAAKTYVDDVFSAYTYTGNGSTQTITNGIDLAGKGGMVWIKNRSTASYGHFLQHTARGTSQVLASESTAGNVNYSPNSISAFLSNGFSLGNTADSNTNTNSLVSWTFRNADKFYNHTTVVKTGGSNATVSFSNLTTLGMVRVKRTDSTGSWYIWHRSLTAGKLLIGGTTAAEATLGHITVSGTTVTLVNGVIADGTYLVEGFAHDTGTDGLIQCGSFTTDGSGNATVTLGWEPQYCMFKSSSGTSNWWVRDTMRGMVTDATNGPAIYANTSDAESASSYHCRPNATGLVFNLLASTTYIYLAIRRPNKPPTTGTQVYNAIARTETQALTDFGFPADLVYMKENRASAGDNHWFTRLSGGHLDTNTTSAESGTSSTDFSFGSTLAGFKPTANSFIQNVDGNNTAKYFSGFKRAPGVMDVVCYTGTGSATTVAHGLGAVPELMIVKNRGSVSNWSVYAAASGNSNAQYLNLTNAAGASSGWNNTTPTASVFSLASNAADYNQSAKTYVAYLFATLAGVSKVGSYTGTATTNAINCGFTTGARFVMIKRTDSTGDWYVWDTTRGIIAGNDPYLLLNSTAAEVTGTDYIDPSTSGFELSSTAPAAINASGGTFIYLAFS